MANGGGVAAAAGAKKRSDQLAQQRQTETSSSYYSLSRCVCCVCPEHRERTLPVVYSSLKTFPFRYQFVLCVSVCEL